MDVAPGGVDVSYPEGLSDGRVQDEAAAAAPEFPAAPVGGVVCNDDPVEDRLVGVGQVYRELTLAGAVEKEAVWVVPDPPLGAPHLVRRLLDGLPEPPAPVPYQVAAVGESAVLVRENDDVVLELDEQVADLLAVALPRTLLVPVDARVAPQRQEGAVAEGLQVALGFGDAVRAGNGATLTRRFLVAARPRNLTHDRTGFVRFVVRHAGTSPPPRAA